MALSNSVLRRYTPPTCTLEIVAPTSSPLSHGVEQPGTTLLSFQLRFNDPRLPDQERVTIAGDRDQLEALHAAVSTYVQDLLNQSLDRFKATVYAGEPPSSAHLNLDGLKDPAAAPSRKICLQPGSGLAHNFFLGPLATNESGPVIQLSVLQLFDLATALDENSADMVSLQGVSQPKRAFSQPAWANIAAILLLGVGLTIAVMQVLKWNPQKQTATTTAPQGSSSKNISQIALQPSPLPKLSPPTQPQSSPEKLPSLPTLDSTVPSHGASLPSVTVPPTTTALKSAPGVTLPRTAPVLPNEPPLIAPPPPIVINPSPRQNHSGFIPGETAVPGTSSALSPTKFPHQAATLPSTPPQLTPANPDLESPPSVATLATAPATETSSNKRNAASSRHGATLPYPPKTSLRNRNPFLEGVLLPGTQTPAPSTPTTPNRAKSTATALNLPQVAEARDYFKQHWEPPQSLKQPLEYNLVLDIDGTIQRIEPIGQEARNYVDRTGIPLIGERFVSPIASGQTAIIRLVLSPDGKVQTFAESSN